MRRQSSIRRREVLTGAAKLTAGAVAFPAIVPSTAFGAPGAPAPSDRITMGFIGVGGRGSALLRNFLARPDAKVLAICDAKEPNRRRAAEVVNGRYRTRDCETHTDLRALVARGDLDAVAIATPDHWHVPAALLAVRAGKDVYVEKPMGVSLDQCKTLRAEVRRLGRVFQFGTQERSSWSTRLACELALSGRVGRIRTIKIGSRFSVASKNYPPAPVPDWLDYDLWLGPAPYAPYTPNRVINNWWFHISDYALGFIAGCGIHTVDMANWGAGKDHTGPVEAEGWGKFPADGLCNCATDWNVNLTFADGLVMNFTDGKQNPLGVKFEGEDGWVFVKERHLGGTVSASPKALLKKPLGPDEVHLPVSNHHQQNFLDAVKTRGRPAAPIDSALRSEALVHLSDIAMRLGRKLKWDPDQEQFTNDPEANRMLRRPVRSPWGV